MCGIAGIISYSDYPIDPRIIHAMMDSMKHRGPDGEGMYCDAHVGLGHVRLSIIDLEGSKQPLTNEDENYWITYNGEIYNYLDLRTDLISRGHAFRTRGDTEVLVHLYEEYGYQMLDKINGMFAFAIWDRRNKTLFMARDRMGIKPLYWCQFNNQLIFASEPKAILQVPGMKAQVNPVGVWHYLTFRSVPSPDTLFQDIHRLKQGYYIVVSPSGVQERCYWDIPLVPAEEKARDEASFQTTLHQVESLLKTSVKRRLISDVPFGAFLSGGLDSSLIVAMMSELCEEPVRTYSVGFRNFPNSELPYARIVADRFKTDHHELILEEDCFAANLEKLTWMRDSPLSERSDVALYLLAAEARKEVKILLSGEGSDELYGGYPKYAYDRMASALGWIPSGCLTSILRYFPQRFRKIEIALNCLSKNDEVERWPSWFAPFSEGEKNRLLNTGSAVENPIRQYLKDTATYGHLDRMLYADCKIWLVDNLLERGDRMTMAASVEGRVPFLDYEFVTLSFGLSDPYKVRGMQRKWLIKQIASKYLPKEIVYRKKVGFEVPLAQWFRGKLKDMCYDRIGASRGIVSEMFSRRDVMNILDEHCSGRKDHFLKIWTLLGLSLWHELFILRSAKQPLS